MDLIYACQTKYKCVGCVQEKSKAMPLFHDRYPPCKPHALLPLAVLVPKQPWFSSSIYLHLTYPWFVLFLFKNDSLTFPQLPLLTSKGVYFFGVFFWPVKVFIYFLVFSSIFSFWDYKLFRRVLFFCIFFYFLHFEIKKHLLKAHVYIPFLIR